MVKVTYYYSACVGLETTDCKIVCDPWFTDGVYDGSWYQYPKLQEPISKIGFCNYIYVSHIHPDHYDPVFIKEYLRVYPKTEILIADFRENYLSRKMKSDEIPHRIVRNLEVGGTQLGLFANELEEGVDVDSALVVKKDGHTAVNVNDNPYCQKQIDQILEFCERRVDIALLGYTGAGPYPQTYYREGAALAEKAQAKKLNFFDRYRQMQKALKPKRTLPFAGKYILGSHLWNLNPFRGVADAVEVLEFDSTAVVLADGGQAWIDTKNLAPSATRTKAYDPKEMQAYAAETKNNKMRYEEYFSFPPKTVPWARLLPKAYENSLRRSFCKEDYWFCLKIEDSWFTMNVRKGSTGADCKWMPSVEQLNPRSEVTVDQRYLFGLVTGVFHWNNAEVGSQFFVNRVPDIFKPSAQSFLNFFHL